MLRIVACLLMLTFFCGLGDARQRSAIWGGAAASAEKFPWMIYLTLRGSGSCSAVLLNNQTILTAAHCVCEVATDDITISLIQSHGKQKVEIAVNAIILHPETKYVDCTKIAGPWDLAILKLSEELPREGLSLDCDYPAPDTDLTIVGFGIRNRDYETGKVLHGELQFAVTKTQTCKQFRDQEAGFICSGREKNGILPGDSGGAALTGDGVQHPYKLVGINSAMGIAIPESYYANVPKYCKWIMDSDATTSETSTTMNADNRNSEYSNIVLICWQSAILLFIFFSEC